MRFLSFCVLTDEQVYLPSYSDNVLFQKTGGPFLLYFRDVISALKCFPLWWCSTLKECRYYVHVNETLPSGAFNKMVF